MVGIGRIPATQTYVKGVVVHFQQFIQRQRICLGFVDVGVDRFLVKAYMFGDCAVRHIPLVIPL